MADGVRTPRSRGGLSGLALILLGAWGGIAPFAGPSLNFGYTPDTAWASTSGRLYLSAIPGGVVLVTGLIVMVTRSRWFGGFCAFVAALGGAWFIAGASLVTLLPRGQGDSISTGTPLRNGVHIVVLTNLAFFTGVGALILFFAALALGRFSIAAHRDFYADDGDVADLTGAGVYGAYQQGSEQPYAAQQQYGSQYSSTDPFPPEHYSSSTEQYPSASGHLPGTEHYQATEQYPPAGQQPTGYPQQDPFGLTQEQPASQYPPSQSPFPPVPFPGYPDQPTTPESTTAAEQPPHGQNQAR